MRQDSLADGEHFEMLTKLSYFIHNTQTVHKDGRRLFDVTYRLLTSGWETQIETFEVENESTFFGTRHVNMFVPAVRLIMLTCESMGVR